MTWDDYFLGLCEAVAAKSKDTSTKVGAVVVRPNQSVASTGWNGFPRGVLDTAARYENRETKYRFVCHAEANAITSAREPLEGCTCTQACSLVTNAPS
jgi:dCMP deaminase